MWAVDQVPVAADEPFKLHTEHRPVEHDQGKKKCPYGPCSLCNRTGDIRIKRGGALIVGWPFSLGFERYLSGQRPVSPWLETMARLYNPRDRGLVQCHEYRILFALVNGHTEPEIVRALVGGCRVDFFQSATVRACELVFDRAKELLDEVN